MNIRDVFCGTIKDQTGLRRSWTVVSMCSTSLPSCFDRWSSELLSKVVEHVPLGSLKAFSTSKVGCTPLGVLGAFPSSTSFLLPPLTFDLLLLSSSSFSFSYETKGVNILGCFQLSTNNDETQPTKPVQLERILKTGTPDQSPPAHLKRFHS